MTRAAPATTQAARLSTVAEPAFISFIVHAPRICRPAPSRKTAAGLQIEIRSCLAPPLSSSRHAYPRCDVLIASSRARDWYPPPASQEGRTDSRAPLVLCALP